MHTFKYDRKERVLGRTVLIYIIMVVANKTETNRDKCRKQEWCWRKNIQMLPPSNMRFPACRSLKLHRIVITPSATIAARK